MRLLLVTRGFPPRVGGVETLCRQLAEGFAARGADVLVATFGGAAPTSVEEGAYRVLRLPSAGDTFEWSRRLAPVLRGLRPDVCHVHNLHSTVAASVWAAGTRPYVLTPHYHGDGHSPVARLIHPAYRLLARRVVRGAAAVTAVSRTEAALIRRDFGVTPEVIPNGVNPAPWSARTRTAPEGPPTVVVVSRLVRYKRVDAVVRALAELPGFHLHVVGDGPERRELARLAARLGVADRMWLTSARISDAAVRGVIRGASVYINLSAAEAFSYTVLEALATGTPVVTSADSALREWSGRFPAAVRTVDPGSPAEVAAAVRTLARYRVDVDLGEYSLPSVLDRYEALYTALYTALRPGPAGRLLPAGVPR